MLSVHTQPSAAGKRSLWRPGVSSLSAGRGASTPVSSDLGEVASGTSSTTGQPDAEFRQISTGDARHQLLTDSLAASATSEERE